MVFYKKSCPKKICNIHRKTPGLESLFNKAVPTQVLEQLCLFATLHVRWLSHIFNCTACIYQTACYSVIFTILSNYYLIDWWCDISLCLFTWWFDSSFFVTEIWDGKPVDSNSHRVSPLYYKRINQPSLLFSWLLLLF